eukprot:TRINITY_DN47252_c0_g2_i2.p1 TRINITY_DN47252_c0_g2~~TRINITY_DN47252_c0_g2_i2.p1  ORF type:complete len:543 (-),score=96.72 TRINITY_DN47252_c0_g2_i2:678-2306(-)
MQVAAMRSRQSSLRLLLRLLGVLHVSTNIWCSEAFSVSCRTGRYDVSGRCIARVAITPQPLLAVPTADGSTEALQPSSFEHEAELYRKFMDTYPSGTVFAGSNMTGCLDGRLPCPFMGLDVDFMAEVIGRQMGWTHEFVVFHSFAEALYAARESSVDMCWLGALITSDRSNCLACPAVEEGETPETIHTCCLDFSHPYFEGGMSVLMRKEVYRVSLIKVLLTTQMANTCLLFYCAMLVTGHMLWLLESRRKHGAKMFPRNYTAGVFEGIYWSCTTATTVGYGDRIPVTYPGKVFTMFWMFGGIVTSGTVAGLMSSAMFSQRLAQVEVNKMADLKGKLVCSIESSSAYQNFMSAEGSMVRNVREASLVDCLDKLMQNVVDAVLYDAPILNNLLAENRISADDFVVSVELKAVDYGVAFPEGSDIAPKVSAAILRAQRQRSWLNHLRATYKTDRAGRSDDEAEPLEGFYVGTAVLLTILMVRLIITVMMTVLCGSPACNTSVAQKCKVALPPARPHCLLICQQCCREAAQEKQLFGEKLVPRYE